MGGNKDGKGDRTYSQRSGGSGGGGGSVSEAGALFPRLHVKETKRVGPRAPPRNKMALYEQFTFPSSRFVPPSIPLRSTARPAPTPVTTTAYGPQRPSLESSMFYGLSPSFGAMPWMPYTAMSNTSNPGGQPSLNGSSGSTIVDGEGDLRHRRGASAADCARPASSLGGQGTVWAPSQSNFSGVSRKRSRLDDYCSVATATAKGAGSREAAGDAVGSDKTMWQPWQQRKVETANNSVRMSVSSDCQVESSGLESLRTNRGANSVSEVARDDEGANKDIIWKGEERHHDGEESEVQNCDTIQEGKNRTHGRKTKFCDADGNVIHRGRQVNHEEKKSLQADFDVASKAPKNRTTDNGDSVKALGNGDQDSSQRRKIISTEGGSSTPSRDPAKGSMEKEDVTARSKGAERELRKRANPSECKSSSFVEADDELETISGVEVSGHSDSEACSDGEESDSSISDPQTPRKMRKLSSRNVVKLLGEQEFWRTRDLLQRQQKIFSEQLFEMHRIIKVQQMLAMAADEVMDEETLGGIGEMPEETLDPDYADEQDVEEVGAEETAPVKGGREARVGVSHENEGDNAEKQPDTCQSSTSHRARGQPPGADPAPELDKAEVSPLPSVGHGESTASWGYPMGPKADVNNWFGAAIPAPTGAFMYQPYPGAFHPPQAHAIATYNSPYGPIVCAPGPMDVSSMPPYAMPRYEQRLDMIPDMYRYNSYQQQWPPAMLCPPVPSNPGAGWYGVPPPMPYLDPALSGSCGWYEDMAPGPAHPSGSSSYIRPPPAHASTAHGIPVPRPATFFMQPSPWADVSHQSSADGEEFRNQQVPWTGVKEAGGQTSSLASQRRATNLSGAEGVTPESPRDGGGVQQSVSRPSSHDTIGNQSAGKGIGYCWGLTASGNDFHDRESNVAEASVRTQSISKDKEEERKQKKSRLESRQDLARETLETDEGRQRVECTDPTESQRDALPLFPLGPVLNTPENRRLASQSSGVIKVVPRAMVATAESAAEILLSIQKQRQL